MKITKEPRSENHVSRSKNSIIVLTLDIAMADFATSLEVINSAVQLRVAIFESVGLFRWPMDDPNESDQSFFKEVPEDICDAIS